MFDNKYLNQKKLLIIILFFAIFLRFYNLGFGDFHTDEAKTALGIDFPHSFLLPTASIFSQNIFDTK